jgi:hypothetical protein
VHDDSKIVFMISCKYISFLQDFVNFKSFFFRKTEKNCKKKGAKAPTLTKVLFKYWGIFCFIITLKADHFVYFKWTNQRPLRPTLGWDQMKVTERIRAVCSLSSPQSLFKYLQTRYTCMQQPLAYIFHTLI